MWHLIHLVAAPAEFLLGLFCLLTAIVLYPGEEGQIQSKFEDFWVRVDDYQQLALSRHAAFMQQVAKLETRFLDRVFGSKLISGRAVGVSVCFSIGTVLLLLFVFIVLGFGGLDWVVSMIVLIGFLLVLGSASFVQKRTILRRGLRAVAFTLLAVCLGSSLPMVYAFAEGLAGGLSMLFLIMLLVVLGGFSCDVLFIALTRRLVRWAGEMTSSLKVLATVVANLLLALFLVGLPLPIFYFSEHIGERPVLGIFTYGAVIIACTNIFDVALVLLFVLLAVMLLIHRALWPLLTRTLFRMQDIGTKGRRAISHDGRTRAVRLVRCEAS